MPSYINLMREFPARADRQVVLDNMQQGPFNRWAFTQMRRLLPSANVWRGDGPVLELGSESVDLDRVEYKRSDGRSGRFTDLFSEDYTDAMVVLKDGVIVHEQYRHNVAPHEPHLLMSVSKSFAGSLAGVLVGQGKLSTDDLVTDIIPEVAGSAYDGARLRHVLDMTVGMEYNEDYEDPDSDIALLDVAAGWRSPREGAPDNLREYIATMRKAGPHGDAFHYVSTNTDLLGWLLERSSGHDFASLLSKFVWQPMGAEHDAYITLDRFGAPQSDGGLCVTTRDLARFGQLQLQQGRIGDRQIVPEAWIDDTRENGDAMAWDRGNFAEHMPGHSYRNKWYINLADSHQSFKGIGIHGQFVFVDPVSKVVIAHHASHPTPADFDYFNDIDSAFCAIGRHLA